MGQLGQQDGWDYRLGDASVASHSRVKPALLAELVQVRGLTSTVSDALDEAGYAPSGVGSETLTQRLDGSVVAGHAVTLRYLPARGDVSAPQNQLVHDAAIDVSGPGDVLVVDAGGLPGVSTFGGMAASVARGAGLGGLIVYGGVRDIEQIREAGLPTWSRATTPRTGKWRLEAAGINDAIACGPVQVRPGDLVLADATGVCFVPSGMAEQIVPAVLEVARSEAMAFSKGVSRD